MYSSIGISIPLAQGLFINQRMADLCTAKLQLSMSSSERQIQVVDLLFKASAAYFNWLKCYNEAALYEEYQRFAQTRFQAVVPSIELGDKPAIDSIEAGIVLKNRKLNVEDANLKLNNAKLELSVFLWIETTPVELQDNIVPDAEIQRSIFETLNLDEVFNLDESVSDNPRIQLLQGRLAQLEIERKLKSNMLLPDISLNYNFISEPAVFNDYRLNDYKAGVSFNLPIFLRKERAGLNIARYKIQDLQLNIDVEKLQLKNRLSAQQNEITSLSKQIALINDLVDDYSAMLQAEERLFQYGESSLFLINARENNLVSSRLSQITLVNRFLYSHAELYRTLAKPQ
ncbi:MAG TPA: TolC family protein [Flavobacterium sp.]|jgi:outer membrane protein TolC